MVDVEALNERRRKERGEDCPTEVERGLGSGKRGSGTAVGVLDAILFLRRNVGRPVHLYTRRCFPGVDELVSEMQQRVSRSRRRRPPFFFCRFLVLAWYSARRPPSDTLSGYGTLSWCICEAIESLLDVSAGVHRRLPRLAAHLFLPPHSTSSGPLQTNKLSHGERRRRRARQHKGHNASAFLSFIFRTRL